MCNSKRWFILAARRMSCVTSIRLVFNSVLSSSNCSNTWLAVKLIQVTRRFIAQYATRVAYQCPRHRRTLPFAA